MKNITVVQYEYAVLIASGFPWWKYQRKTVSIFYDVRNIDTVLRWYFHHGKPDAIKTAYSYWTTVIFFTIFYNISHEIFVVLCFVGVTLVASGGFCLDSPSHYLNCCLIVNWTLGNKLQWNLNRNKTLFIHGNAFETVVCEMVAILYRGMS